jgi:WD40 repeat protein
VTLAAALGILLFAVLTAMPTPAGPAARFADESAARRPSQSADLAMTIDAPAEIRLATVCHGGHVVGAGKDPNVYVWSIPAGTLTGTIAAGERVSTLACSPDGRWIAAGTQSGLILLIDARTRDVAHRLTVTQHLINTIVFSPDSSLLAACPDDGPAQLWNVETGSRGAVLQTPAGASLSVAFSADADRIATADEDTRVRLSERSGKLLRELDAGLLASMDVAFSADGSQVLAAGVDRTITVFDASSGNVARRSAAEADLMGYLMRLPDGHSFAVLELDEFTLAPTMLKAWDIRSGQFRSLLSASDVIGAAIVSNGLVVVTARGDKRRLEIRTVR